MTTTQKPHIWAPVDEDSIRCLDCDARYGGKWHDLPCGQAYLPACEHEWEYSDQSEPHKGRDYYTCRLCDTVVSTDPDTGELFV